MNLTRSGNWSRGPTPRRAARRRGVDQVAERGAGQAPFLDDADLVVVVGKLPAFGVIRLVADRLVQDGSQPPASPDQPAQDGFESQGIERVIRHYSRFSTSNSKHGKRPRGLAAALFYNPWHAIVHPSYAAFPR